MVFQATILLQRKIEKALEVFSKRSKGCISCIHSKPDERDPVNIKARRCELGKSFYDCNSWRQILSERGMKGF